MFCKYCGKEIDNAATKCPYCEAVVAQPAPQPAPQVAPVQQEVKKTEYVYIPPRKQNTMAIAGFILAFFIPIVGLILSIIGLKNAKTNNDDGKGLAIGGVIIGALGTVGYAFLFLILILSIVGAAGAVGGIGATAIGVAII